MLHYIPAVSVGATLGLTEKGVKFKDKSINWWSDDALFSYPHMMISAYHGINQKYDEVRKKFKVGKNVKLWGDSGGFSRVSIEKSVDPLLVLRWLERNANVGFILDYPPVIINSTNVHPTYITDEKEFDEIGEDIIRH